MKTRRRTQLERQRDTLLAEVLALRAAADKMLFCWQGGAGGKATLYEGIRALSAARTPRI